MQETKITILGKLPSRNEAEKASLYKSMLDCVVLGLSISKAQAYIIPYGNTAQLSVSYQGKKAIAMRIDPTIEDINSWIYVRAK